MMNLADPELELLDPTPNVHSMFLHFDKTFFWAKLSSQCIVRWSKRMYSCAGICSYEGRGGLCNIALSEPLLKLRPRKDLVETLLHEMIHAFLFVTRRDQDRDGHGPNFQSHMHRINRAAGLNISIYHDFHDEVKLYQTHWWRCNGPCQLNKPFFGIVRRTNNRAPGPSDYWWNRHQKNCGGTFIKIKEPEKPQLKSKKADVKKTNTDITKYISNNNNKETSNKNIMQNNKPKKPILKNSSNVPFTPKIGIKSNNSSTLVVAKKNIVFNPQVPKPELIVFSGIGQPVCISQSNKGEHKNTTSTSVLETVRNVWAKKQISIDNTKENFNKHKAEPHSDSPPPKIKKIDDYFKSAATSMLKNLYGQDFNITQSNDDQKLKVIPKNDNLVDCPVCDSQIDSGEINKHLDECLNKDIIEKLSKKNIPLVIQEGDKTQFREETGISLSTIELKKETVIPNTYGNKDHKPVINNDSIELPNMSYINNINRKRSKTSFNQVNTEQAIDTINEKNNNLRKSGSFTKPTALNTVQNISLQNSPPIVIIPSIKAESSCSKSDSITETACPCCGDKLNKSIDEHFDECLSFFENNTTIPEEGASTSRAGTIVIDDDDDDKFDESQIFNATATKFPCPCCLKMIEETDMNSHLDKCLNKGM